MILPSCPPDLLDWHTEVGVIHAERREDALAIQNVERLSRGDLENAAEKVGSGTVFPALPGLEVTGDRGHGGTSAPRRIQNAGFGMRDLVGLELGHPLLGGGAVEGIRDAAGHVEEVLDGEWGALDLYATRRGVDQMLLELGEILCNGVVKLNDAFLDQLERDRGREELRHRVDLVDRVRLVRAESFEELDLPVLDDADRRSSQAPAVDCLLDEPSDTVIVPHDTLRFVVGGAPPDPNL